MRAIIVIPARFGSTRFPGKPLARDTGRYLIQHTYEQAARARRAERVIIATDDVRIAEAARGFGAEVAMTPADCPSGTDRVAAACRSLAAGAQPDVVVNVQGDEPELDPRHVDALIELLEQDPDAAVGTLAVPSKDPVVYRSPHVVKVVLGQDGRALYFSRAPIPYDRAGAGVPREGFLWHVGIYAYRASFLQRWADLPPSLLEMTEGLEQLRVLEAGYRIRVGRIAEAAPGIDTPEEYRAFCERVSCRGSR